jgi:predicted PurR-regulated permease PerM
VIAFGAIFGIMGLVIAVPLLVVLKVFVERLYIEDVLEKRPANDG